MTPEMRERCAAYAAAFAYTATRLGATIVEIVHAGSMVLVIVRTDTSELVGTVERRITGHAYLEGVADLTRLGTEHARKMCEALGVTP